MNANGPFGTKEMICSMFLTNLAMNFLMNDMNYICFLSLSPFLQFSF